MTLADPAAVAWAQQVAILEYRKIFKIRGGGDRVRQIDSLQIVADLTNDMVMILLVRETTQ